MMGVLTTGGVLACTGRSLAYTRVDFYNAKGQLAAFGRAFLIPSLLSLSRLG